MNPGGKDLVLQGEDGRVYLAQNSGGGSAYLKSRNWKIEISAQETDITTARVAAKVGNPWAWPTADPVNGVRPARSQLTKQYTVDLPTVRISIDGLWQLEDNPFQDPLVLKVGDLLLVKLWISRRKKATLTQRIDNGFPMLPTQFIYVEEAVLQRADIDVPVRNVISYSLVLLCSDNIVYPDAQYVPPDPNADLT